MKAHQMIETKIANPSKIVAWDFDGPITHITSRFGQLNPSQEFESGDPRCTGLQVANLVLLKLTLNILQKNNIKSILTSQRCVMPESHSHYIQEMYQGLNHFFGEDRACLLEDEARSLYVDVGIVNQSKNEMLNRILARHCIAPSNIILVDDAYLYKSEAESAGYQFVHVPRENKKKNDSAQAMVNENNYLYEILFLTIGNKKQVNKTIDILKNEKCVDKATAKQFKANYEKYLKQRLIAPVTIQPEAHAVKLMQPEIKPVKTNQSESLKDNHQNRVVNNVAPIKSLIVSMPSYLKSKKDNQGIKIKKSFFNRLTAPALHPSLIGSTNSKSAKSAPTKNLKNSINFKAGKDFSKSKNFFNRKWYQLKSSVKQSWKKITDFYTKHEYKLLIGTALGGLAAAALLIAFPPASVALVGAYFVGGAIAGLAATTYAITTKENYSEYQQEGMAAKTTGVPGLVTVAGMESSTAKIMKKNDSELFAKIKASEKKFEEEIKTGKAKKILRPVISQQEVKALADSHTAKKQIGFSENAKKRVVGVTTWSIKECEEKANLEQKGNKYTKTKTRKSVDESGNITLRFADTDKLEVIEQYKTQYPTTLLSPKEISDFCPSKREVALRKLKSTHRLFGNSNLTRVIAEMEASNESAADSKPSTLNNAS